MDNRGTSVDGGWKLVYFGLCVFSGNFGVRSIVLWKCSCNVLIGYNKMVKGFAHYPLPCSRTKTQELRPLSLKDDRSFVSSLIHYYYCPVASS